MFSPQDAKDFISLATTILSSTLGISNQENISDFLYSLIIFWVAAWLSVFTFILVKRRDSLQHWRFPTLVNLGGTLITTLISFVASWLLLANLDFFILLFGGIRSTIEPLHILAFMIIYISIGLITIHRERKIKSKAGDLLPPELSIFISNSFAFIFGLFFIALSQIMVLESVGKLTYGLFPEPNTLWQVVGASIFIAMFGLLMIFAALNEKRFNIFLKKINYLTTNYPQFFLAIIGLFALMNGSYALSKSQGGIEEIVVGIFFIILGAFTPNLKRYLQSKRKLFRLVKKV